MSDWWRAVEGALERLSDEGPDPWADAAVPADGAELTPEQRAFLAQLADDRRVHLADDDSTRPDDDAGAVERLDALIERPGLNRESSRSHVAVDDLR